MRRTRLGGLLTGCVVAATPWLHGCTGQAPQSGQGGIAQTAARSDERTCLIRAMYFESNRSSRDGLMAVGTVVMNRVASPRYPNTICGVVGQPGQFARGVMTAPLNPRELPAVERAADAILAGERYKPIGDAMFFHVAGLKIPYRVEYMAVAGGNAFYRKTGRSYAAISPTPVRATTSFTATASEGASETALAAAPEGSIIERFFGGFSAAASPAHGTCDAAKAGLGATSLACEDDASGR
ncbi:cell wall hydrolase [Methyloceanibacter sp.]|uniref:cell wall hydrolase n=1 Tax=Methyloceanibacter sp. TaxID=1965321 RepID=UPI002D418561|nr:cell wall hydrolase [Methyloceanibacter sp.]HZP10773.1 cell wall hydrolase [Methyloceanibacter sp.]